MMSECPYFLGLCPWKIARVSGMDFSIPPLFWWSTDTIFYFNFTKTCFPPTCRRRCERHISSARLPLICLRPARWNGNCEVKNGSIFYFDFKFLFLIFYIFYFDFKYFILIFNLLFRFYRPTDHGAKGIFLPLICCRPVLACQRKAQPKISNYVNCFYKPGNLSILPIYSFAAHIRNIQFMERPFPNLKHIFIAGIDNSFVSPSLPAAVTSVIWRKTAKQNKKNQSVTVITAMTWVVDSFLYFYFCNVGSKLIWGTGPIYLGSHWLYWWWMNF